MAPSDPPPLMRAVVLNGHGGLDQLSSREIRTPVPKPGEVLVRIGGAAVNNTDVNLRVGWYSKGVTGATDALATSGDPGTDGGWAGDALTFPRIQGADGAGRIVAVGDGVNPQRVGERVLIDPILRQGPKPLYFGSDVPGSFAEYTCVPSDNAVCIRTSLSDVQLASFPCSYVAALHMVTRAQVRAGQTVLVSGASGGVGTAAVQWCRARGARVIAVAEPSKHPALAALGAAVTLGREQPLPSVIPPDSLDVVLDVVGGRGFAERLAVLKPHGHYATAGAIAGAIVELDLRTLYLKDLTLHGCTIPPVDLFRDLVRAIENGDVQPLIAATYPLPEVADAQRAFQAKAHLGKIAIQVAPDNV